MTSSAEMPAGTGALVSPIVSAPSSYTSSVPTVSRVAAVVRNASRPTTPTQAIAASLTVSYVTVLPAAIRTRSLAPGTRAGDHVAGSDHAPERALEIVGPAHRSGTPAGTLCALASATQTISEHTTATQPSAALC